MKVTAHILCFYDYYSPYLELHQKVMHRQTKPRFTNGLLGFVSVEELIVFHPFALNITWTLTEKVQYEHEMK